MIQKIIDWIIKRELKKKSIHVDIGDTTSRGEFIRVLNTLRENKIMVVTREDGIYIRLAGDVNKSQSFSTEFVKVKSF